MAPASVVLRPFEVADLPLVDAWFDEPDTLRWLGDREWPRMALRMAESSPQTQALLATAGGVAVGLLLAERYDESRASFALVTAPALRRQGLGTAMLDALAGDRLTAGATELFAGAEAGNTASGRLLARSGFSRVTEQDDVGFEYWVRRVDGLPVPPAWSRPA